MPFLPVARQCWRPIFLCQSFRQICSRRPCSGQPSALCRHRFWQKADHESERKNCARCRGRRRYDLHSSSDLEPDESRFVLNFLRVVILQSADLVSGTTIPAGTAVMTGTPAGVGAFQSPKSFLKDGDEVDVELTGVGTLRNTVRFEE